jgi:hypothetical protein
MNDVGDIPVKVPIPNRLLTITDQKHRSAVMREWWQAYAKRYPDYRAARYDKKYVYMERRENN